MTPSRQVHRSATVASVALVAGFILYVAFFAHDARKVNALRAASAPAAVRTPMTLLDVDMTDAKVLGTLESTSGPDPRSRRVWTAVQTHEWLFLNSDIVGRTCPDLLGVFARANVSEGPGFTPETLELLVSSLEGKLANIGAFVPRYANAPDLAKCPGFAYDVQTHMLRVGARRVALLAKQQPGLAY